MRMIDYIYWCRRCGCISYWRRRQRTCTLLCLVWRQCSALEELKLGKRLSKMEKWFPKIMLSEKHVSF